MKFNINFKWLFAIACVVICALFLHTCEKNKEIKNVKIEESNLRKALADTLHHFRTKEGAWGVEKLTMQTDLKTLKDENLVLNVNQKKLIKSVEEQNKTSQTIAAALLVVQAELRDIKNDRPVEVTDTTVRFTHADTTLQYDITVADVKPLERPRLSINSLKMPNTQTINFHWKDERKEGYPVSFSIINTSPYFKVHDIQSYVIPEIKKTELKPNFWDKLGKGINTGVGKITIFGLGAGAGIAAYEIFINK